MRRLAKLLALLVLAGVVALCVGGLAVGIALTWPARSTIGAPPDDLGAESVEFASTSGATIRGWFVKGRPGVGAVVLLHGVGGNRIPMLQRARMLREAGYSVLLFDFQAHGESTGSWITLGQREGRDAASAVTFVRQRLPAEKVAVIGVSLGGAAALLAPAPLAVDALVLEGAFPDIDTAIANRIQRVLGPWLGPLMRRPLAEVLVTMTSPIVGVSRAELRPIDRIGAVGAPLLILIGEADKHTTVAETQAMFERAREPKSMWVVPGAGHVDLRDQVPEAYRARVLQFLTEWLRT